MEMCPDESSSIRQKESGGECQSLPEEPASSLSQIAWEYVRRDATSSKTCPRRQPDTADGGFVIDDAAGKTVTTWADGTHRVQGPDERGYVRRQGSTGTWKEEHWGKRPEENFQITRNSDGSLQVTDKKGDNPMNWMKDSSVETSRNRLLESADRRIQDPQHLSKFRADMARLEHRALEHGLNPSEIAMTYESISRIIQAEGDKPLTAEQRIAVAQQTLSQAARPGSVDQGIYGSCNVASVEVRTYTRVPSAAAKLVADVATIGSFQAKDGSKVQIRTSSLQPHGGAEKNPPEDGTRSHASQIFQVTAVNLGHLKKNPHYEYVLVERNGTDNGERLYNKMQGKDNDEVIEDGKPVRAPSLNEDQIEAVSNIITGKQESGFVIVHDGYRSGDEIKRVKSKVELNETLETAQREGKFPVILRVDAANQPFFRDSDRGTAGGADGAHVVTVTGYTPGPPAKVTVDNTWGSKSDHPRGSEITTHDLYAAMRSASDKDRLKEMRYEVKFDQRRNQADPVKVFDLHRQEHDAKLSELNEAEAKHSYATQQRINGEITHKEYTQARTAHERAKQQYGGAQEKYYQSILKDARETARTWSEKNSQGVLDKNDKARGVTMMLDVASTLPPDLRLKALKEYRTLGVVSDEQFDHAIGQATRDAQKTWNEERKTGTLDSEDVQRVRTATAEIIWKLPEDRIRPLLDSLPIEERLFHVSRAKHFNLISEDEMSHQLGEIMIAARVEWADAEKTRTLDAAEKVRCLQRINELLSSLPANSRREVQMAVQAAG